MLQLLTTITGTMTNHISGAHVYPIEQSVLHQLPLDPSDKCRTEN